jgi:hypothetical protein
LDSVVRWKIAFTYLPGLAAIPVVLVPPMNHDVAAILEFSQRWLAGEALYSRLIDANPPLIFVLNLVPAALARLTALSAVWAFQLCMLSYGCVIWWLAIRVRQERKEGSIERLFLDLVPVLVLVAAGNDFAQREHLMTLGALPYLFSAARRARGERPPHHFAVAVIAAAVFGLKPHFLAVPALVEFYLVAVLGPRAAVRDPVPWTMAAIWAAYVALLPVLFPNYIDFVLPLVWSNYLVLGDMSAWQMILLPRLYHGLLLLMPLGLLALLGRDPLSKTLALAAAGGAASAIVQHKGWSYHFLPLESFSLMLAGVLAARALDLSGTAHRFRHACACGLALLVVQYEVLNDDVWGWKRDYADSSDARIAKTLTRAAEGGRGLVLSPRMGPIFPALNYAHVRTTMPTLTMWVLQAAYGQCLADGRRYRDPGEMDWAERFMFQTISQDFAADPPEVVVIDQTSGIKRCDEDFIFLEYFLRDPAFAKTWSRYRRIGDENEFDFYARGD